MLTESKFSEIREHLESSQNPLFLFDNDVDGLVSFLLLRRFVGRGKGVPIKSFPELDDSYTRKIEEFGSDKIFILDKPLVSKEFLEYAQQHNLPVIWIDHHPLQTHEGVYYYNPLNGKKPSSVPTSYICWRAVKKDDWLAMIGCIADWYMPEFAKDFSEKYPSILSKVGKPEDALFDSPLGKIVLMLGHGLRDSTTNVMKMIKALTEIEGPNDILSPNKHLEQMVERYEKLDKIYKKMLKKALSSGSDEQIFFFRYSGDMALSRNLCNELFYLKKGKKIVVIVKINGERAQISMTGPNDKDLRIIVAEALKIISGTGGGHKQAVGASINVGDLDRFKEIVESYA